MGFFSKLFKSEDEAQEDAPSTETETTNDGEATEADSDELSDQKTIRMDASTAAEKPAVAQPSSRGPEPEPEPAGKQASADDDALTQRMPPLLKDPRRNDAGGSAGRQKAAAASGASRGRASSAKGSPPPIGKKAAGAKADAGAKRPATPALTSASDRKRQPPSQGQRGATGGRELGPAERAKAAAAERKRARSTQQGLGFLKGDAPAGGGSAKAHADPAKPSARGQGQGDSGADARARSGQQESPPKTAKGSPGSYSYVSGRVQGDTGDRNPAPTAASSIDYALDEALDRLTSEKVEAPPANGAADHEGDQRAVTETFQAVAANHAQQVREFMCQLSLMRMPRGWAAGCRPIVAPLLDAARQIGIGELTEALEAFDGELQRAGQGESAHIDEAAQAALVSAYKRMAKQLPEAFRSLDESDGRRLLLLESVLLQVPWMYRRTLSKLYAAGLSSLDQLARADAAEVAAVAGIEVDLARSLIEHVKSFEQDRSAVAPAELKKYLLEQMRVGLERYSQAHSNFERAEHEELVDEKREARRARQTAALELDQILVEIGEIGMLEDLKRLPVRNRVRRIEEYLQASA